MRLLSSVISIPLNCKFNSLIVFVEHFLQKNTTFPWKIMNFLNPNLWLYSWKCLTFYIQFSQTLLSWNVIPFSYDFNTLFSKNWLFFSKRYKFVHVKYFYFFVIILQLFFHVYFSSIIVALIPHNRNTLRCNFTQNDEK